MKSARVLLLLLLSVLVGCASYVTPGRPADLTIFKATSSDIRAALEREPAAAFPVSVALVRLQDTGYRNHRYRGYGIQRYSVTPAVDIETDEQMRRWEALPEVRQVARLNRLLLPANASTEKDIRVAAARLRAGVVAIYTLDTRFHLDGRTNVLDVVSLGLLRRKKARISSLASAILVDTQTGFVYGTAEARAEHEKKANSWTTADSVDESRRATETRALDLLVGEFEKSWPRIVAAHARR